MAEKETKKEIFFELGSKRAVWRTPDGSISLNRFTGNTRGKVSTANENDFKRVQQAIFDGDLIDTKKDLQTKVEQREAIVDITNMAEEKAKHRIDAGEILRKLHKDELLERIAATKNPYLVAAMIELESRGRNVSKRRRDDIVDVLKKRLEQICKDTKNKVVMTQYLEDTDEQYQITRDKDATQDDF